MKKLRNLQKLENYVNNSWIKKEIVTITKYLEWKHNIPEVTKAVLRDKFILSNACTSKKDLKVYNTSFYLKKLK
jgi:hypothetical protein